MSLHQSAGPLIVPPGVVVINFVEDMTKAPSIGAHKIGCREVAFLRMLLALDVKFGECTSYSCSLRTSDYINFLLDYLAMYPDGGSN